jgi:hypothetical protein
VPLREHRHDAVDLQVVPVERLPGGVQREGPRSPLGPEERVTRARAERPDRKHEREPERARRSGEQARQEPAAAERLSAALDLGLEGGALRLGGRRGLALLGDLLVREQPLRPQDQAGAEAAE